MSPELAVNPARRELQSVTANKSIDPPKVGGAGSGRSNQRKAISMASPSEAAARISSTAMSCGCERRYNYFERSGMAERGGLADTECAATMTYHFRHRAGPVRNTRSHIVEVTP